MRDKQIVEGNNKLMKLKLKITQVIKGKKKYGNK